MPQRVIVVGAGAAGLMAAGRAAEAGAATVLVEATARPGTKLGLAGGGRGNVAADLNVDASLAHYFPFGQFLRNALSRWGASELRGSFLARISMPTTANASSHLAIVPVKRLTICGKHCRVVRQEGRLAD